MDDTNVNDNQSRTRAAPIPDTTLFVDFESLEVLKTSKRTKMSKSGIPPKSIMKNIKRQITGHP
jgi:hypothetical protein